MTGPDSVPRIPRGVRLHHDRVRDRWVLLAPEKTIALDEIGHAILSEIDARSDIAAIAARLAARYDAPQDRILPDVTGFVAALAQRRILEVA